MTRTTRPTQGPARRGFTLIELLVVIGIILVLASLSIVAITKSVGYQQRRNTETEIAKLDQAFQKLWMRVIDMAKTETPNSNEMALAGNDPRRAQVIHVKLRLVQMFPTSVQEAKNGAPLLGSGGANLTNQVYVRAMANATAGKRSWQDESAACLYVILKQSIRGGDYDPDTALSSQELRDPFPADGQGLKEILDGMGNPIVFCRFPGVAPSQSSPLTNFMNPGGNPQAVPPSHDPVDPEGLLTDSGWISTIYTGTTTCGQWFSTNVHPVVAGKNYNLTPVIFSQGYDATPFTKDDVFNFQITP
jgi:prepilin-type N-terminal cleavage/methylation domain-containing protein